MSPTGRARPGSRPDPARRVALDGLLAVEQSDAYLNLLLPRLLRERGISGRDAAFATEIGYGAARRAGVLAEVVAAAGGRDPDRLDLPVRAVLLLGSYQLLHTRVPARAAVATSVDLVRAVAGHGPAGLVNAVLRRVSELDWAGWVARLAPADPIAGAAFIAGYPEWVATAWHDALGGDVNELAAALDDGSPPTVHLAARPGRISREELLEQAGPVATPGRWSPYAVRLSGGDPAALPAVRSGEAGVQDEGSQLVAVGLAAATLAGPDTGCWLDACAGPGGKSALLQGLLPVGGRLLSADRAEHRSRLVASALNGGAAPHLVLVADSRRPAWSPGRFDRVLLDAPCTGLGALRRRPEARWRKQPDDPRRLAGLQTDLLAAAIDSSRHGGVVAYATCSPHLSETREVVDAVLAGRSDAARLDAWSALPALPRPSAAGGGDPRDVQLWPHRHGTDAMYLALLRIDRTAG